MKFTTAQEEGYALVLVIWGLALLSLIAAALVSETHQSALFTAARIGQAQASLLAKSGIERALLSIDLAPTELSWPEDGQPAVWHFAGGTVTVAIEDEAGKVDAFNAPDMMLDGVLAEAGIELARRQTIERELHALAARSLVAGDRLDIVSLDDLQGRTSLTVDEIERLRPSLTLRSGFAGFDPLVASKATLAAIPGQTGIGVEDYLHARQKILARADAPRRPPSPSPTFTQISLRGAFSIRAEACTADGRLAIREEVVRRDAPGKFTRLERREPLSPRFVAACAPSRRNSSTHS